VAENRVVDPQQERNDGYGSAANDYGVQSGIGGAARGVGNVIKGAAQGAKGIAQAGWGALHGAHDFIQGAYRRAKPVAEKAWNWAKEAIPRHLGKARDWAFKQAGGKVGDSVVAAEDLENIQKKKAEEEPITPPQPEQQAPQPEQQKPPRRRRKRARPPKPTVEEQRSPNMREYGSLLMPRTGGVEYHDNRGAGDQSLAVPKYAGLTNESGAPVQGPMTQEMTEFQDYLADLDKNAGVEGGKVARNPKTGRVKLQTDDELRKFRTLRKSFLRNPGVATHFQKYAAYGQPGARKEKMYLTAIPAEIKKLTDNAHIDFENFKNKYGRFGAKYKYVHPEDGFERGKNSNAGLYKNDGPSTHADWSLGIRRNANRGTDKPFKLIKRNF